MSRVLFPLIVSGIAAMALTWSNGAHAALDACGDLVVDANAKCEVRTSGGCTAQCEPVSLQAACSAKLYVDCDGKCNVDIDANCNVDCNASCSATCNVTPPAFDCKGSCETRCGADCTGSCATAGDKTQCEASCKATCGGKCDVSCQGTPPSATCDAKCQASCTGSCKAKANVDCQVKCQADGYVKCQADLKGGCTAQCAKPEGALFCNDQYVDVKSKVDDCIAQLNQVLNVKVQATGAAQCTGTDCTAQGTAKASCAAAPEGTSSNGLGTTLFGASLAVAIGAVLRRRRRD